jgi:hypothetical protein
MKTAVLTCVAILFGIGFAFAADTDAGTAGRPTAVLSGTDCVSAWQSVAGDASSRFHRGHDGLSPANVKGIVTNFQQADTDKDGSISQAEFIQACKLGVVTASASDRNIAEY